MKLSCGIRNIAIIALLLYAGLMENFLTAIFTTIGLVLVLEGIIYALYPEGMQRMMAQMLTLPPASLRRAGLVFAVIGCIIVWAAKSFS